MHGMDSRCILLGPRFERVVNLDKVYNAIALVFFQAPNYRETVG